MRNQIVNFSDAALSDMSVARTAKFEAEVSSVNFSDSLIRLRDQYRALSLDLITPVMNIQRHPAESIQSRGRE